jgi:hypothetical protein
MLAQVPLAPPVTDPAQDMQLSVHAVLQQKPLAQKPLEHWFAPAHDAPLECLATQLPLAQ